jgi:hypothetical protein
MLKLLSALFLLLMPGLSSSYACNHTLLEIRGDTYFGRIWSGIKDNPKAIREDLTFLEKDDYRPEEKKKILPKALSFDEAKACFVDYLHNPSKGEGIRGALDYFVENCEKISAEDKDTPAIQTSVNMLLERVKEKFTNHVIDLKEMEEVLNGGKKKESKEEVLKTGEPSSSEERTEFLSSSKPTESTYSPPHQKKIY